MEFKIYKKENVKIAELLTDKYLVKEVQDFLDLMANANYLGADRMIIKESNLIPEFFDLKTRFAGDLLQKISNYRQKLAIVGNFSKYRSKSLRDFIFESNKYGRVLFLDSVPEAVEKL